MTIYIEIRKIEKAFGSDKWAIRFGDIAGSTNMHNISKADLIKAVISEVEEEAKKLVDDEINKTIITKLSDSFIDDIETEVSKKYHSQSGNVNGICYDFKQEFKKRLCSAETPLKNNRN